MDIYLIWVKVKFEIYGGFSHQYSSLLWNCLRCVFITNLSYSSTWGEIKELFDGATYVKLFKNQDSEQHEGCEKH